MNRFFDRNEYRRDFPRRAFVRLDDIEPIAPGPEDELTFVLDAIDADWKGFGEGGPFDLSDPNLEHRIARYWRSRFGGDGDGEEAPDGYEEVPIYQLELSLSPGQKFFDLMPRNEELWLSIELSDVASETPINVYGGLFGEPVRAYLHSPRLPHRQVHFPQCSA